MSEFMRTYFLRQHTPIIHFQSDEQGAILRATEVKPKLDRFLIRKIGDWDSIATHWKVGGEKSKHHALDYKLSFRALSWEKTDIPDRYPLFFGNMGERNARQKKKFVFAWEGVEMQVFCLHEDILSLISEHLGEFFMFHNFGTRQSKGFGSFTFEDHHPGAAFYRFSVESSNIDTIFETIDLFYKSLRGGINGARHPNPPARHLGGFTTNIYLKPMVFQYAASKGVEWEKRAIKQAYFDRRLEDDANRHEDDPPSPLHFRGNQRIVRDVLGLSSDQSWKDYPRRGQEAKITKTNSNDRGEPKPKKDQIERLASPLFFKPVRTARDEFMIYFRLIVDEESYQEYLNARFLIENDGRGHLHLPVWKEFELSPFLQFAFADGRLENSIDVKGGDPKARGIADELIRIYSEIRES